MKNNKLFIVSFITNILTFLLVLVGVILMLTIRISALGTTDITVFKYFTFQSNVFMGIVALIYAIYQLLILLNKRDNLPHVLLVFNHIGTTAVGLTFLVVIFFLAPGYGFHLMYRGANLFFHGIVPVIAMINFMFIQKECNIKFSDTVFSIIPSLLYGIVYFIVVVATNGYGDINIDFYMFGANGPLIGAFNFLAVMSIAYIFGLILYFVHKLVFKKR